LAGTARRVRQTDLDRLAGEIELDDLAGQRFQLVTPLLGERDRDTPGLQAAAGGEPGLEDQPILDVDSVFDLKIREDQIARLVGVAQADEVERYAHLGGL